MSDVSKTNAELIQSARQWVSAPGGVSTPVTDAYVRRLADALESATRAPEQGEASAAIERVRLYCENQGDKFRFHAGVILAALDGAPEPEWEWGSAHRDDPSVGATEYSKERAEQRVLEWNKTTRSDTGMLVRRRKAGPWEQIKGESE